jgi:FkbM family methyltransferase
MRMWLDVGANRGGKIMESAAEHDDIIVYAFEPNLLAVAGNIGRYSNYIVVPAVVTVTNGVQILQLADSDTASTIMPINWENTVRWQGGPLTVTSRIPVPAIRLDTFMDAVGIGSVEQLTVDAQGADLDVLKSAGDRISDIESVRVEVAVTPFPVYVGAPTKQEVIGYMDSRGFRLTGIEPSSYGQEEYLQFVQ